jgi:hypothetical protein
MSTFFWINVAGHRLRSIYDAEQAEHISRQFRGDGMLVTLEPAPDPDRVPHGEDGHRCNDLQAACWEAARRTGTARYYEGCRRDTITRQRERGEDQPNGACGCRDCRPAYLGEVSA